MSVLEPLNAALNLLASRYGIEGLGLEAAGSTGITLESGTQLFLEYLQDRGMVFLYTPLLPIPRSPELQLPLFQTMLELNCLEIGSGGGVLSLYPQLDTVIYHQSLPLEGIDADRLDEAFNRLVARAAELSLLLEGEPGNASAPPAALPDGAFAF